MDFEECFPLCQLKSNDIEGRYIVAAKDIKEGETIMEEQPAVRCPPYSTKPVCLGCYTFVQKDTCFPCPKCNWPMCSEDCCSKEDHLLECEVFSSAGFKVNYQKFDYENFEPLYDTLTPIRMLALKDKKPKDWQNLKSLMSHLDIWKKDPGWVEDHEFAANFILDNLIMNVKKDDILELFGIGYINDFSMIVGDVKPRVCYPKVAMISHDCAPNVARYIHNIGANNKIQCIAATNIKKGEKLSITYLDVLQPGFIRREILSKSKNFECICQRCQDPTELGSYGSSLKCKTCPTGFLSPPDWKCDGKCQKSMAKEKAENILRDANKRVEALMEDQSTWTVMNFEKYIVDHKDILHPTNNCMVRIKNSLVGFYGRCPGFEVQQLIMKPPLLNRKEQLADEVYKVLNLLQPGICPIKGVLLFEMHMPIFLKAQFGLCQGLVDISDALEDFRKSLDYIKKALEHLKFEVEGSFGHEQKMGAQDSYQQLSNLVQQLSYM